MGLARWAGGTYGVLRSQQEGDGGFGRAALRLGVRSKDLQERLKGSLGRVGGAAKDAPERVSAAALDPAGAAVPGGADGGVLLRRGLRPALGVRPAGALTAAAVPALTGPDPSHCRRLACRASPPIPLVKWKLPHGAETRLLCAPNPVA